MFAAPKRAHLRLRCQLHEEGDPKARQHKRRARHLHQRAKRIGALEVEGTTALGRQGLAQEYQTADHAKARKARRDHEGRARPDLARDPAQRRAEHEACRARTAEHSEGRPAPLWRDAIGDAGIGRRPACAHDARHHPPRHQPGQRRRPGHHGVVERQQEQRRQQHRPPPEPVAEASDEGRAQELHPGIGKGQQPADLGRAIKAGLRDLPDQARHDGQDQPDAQHVDKDDERDRRQNVRAFPPHIQNIAPVAADVTRV